MSDDGGGGSVGSGDKGGSTGGSGFLGDLFGSGDSSNAATAAPSFTPGADTSVNTVADASPWSVNPSFTTAAINSIAPAVADNSNTAPGTGFMTSDAALQTAGPSTAASIPDFAGGNSGPTFSGGGSGPSFSDWTTGVSQNQPFAAGGTSGFTSPDAAPGANVSSGLPSTSTSAGAPLSAPLSGIGASSVAPGASTGGAAPADATSSWADMLKKGLTSNPLGAAISAAGLGYNILNGQKQTPNQTALTQAAQQAGTNNTALTKAGTDQVTANQANAAEINKTATALEQPLQTGNLPPQYTQQIDQAINDAKTRAISNAAASGQNTDPTKNTALAQQIAQIENQRSAMTTQVAQQLFSSGAGLTSTAANIGNASASSLLSGGQNSAGLSADLYKTLTGLDTKQSEQTAKAIAALAQALNGGTAKAA